MEPSRLYKKLRDLAGALDFLSLRHVSEHSESLSVRDGVMNPVSQGYNEGAMIMVHHAGGSGYAATSDFSDAGLRAALDAAKRWAALEKQSYVTDFSALSMPAESGAYASPEEQPWQDAPLSEKRQLLMDVGETLKSSPHVVDSEVCLMAEVVTSTYLATTGAEVVQEMRYVAPHLSATAEVAGVVQSRSLNGYYARCRQGGYEALAQINLSGEAQQVAEEAAQLAQSPNCPTDTRDVIIAPDQMILQIHESIGHPIELDRILGDERNYAGTSFVTLDMFGEYQYGSELLNVTYDPHVSGQLATYGYDDEGLKAEKQYVIKDGRLVRPLGGVISQSRAAHAGVANVRAQDWNRPPIDRMANLNVEPGTSSFADMINATESGILLRTNNSWSIDDSRNKFQFGCEWGQLIENGQLTKVVKNPGYRGISATFWRSLVGCGNADTFEMYGTPHCGKGEPNQVIRVGHASPTCRFSNVSVFGGV